jgi:hypothetical protein
LYQYSGLGIKKAGYDLVLFIVLVKITLQFLKHLMKKSIITLAAFFLMISAFAEAPSEKVLKLFNATFSSPQEVAWYDNQDYYTVSFVQDGILTRVNYDKEGNFLSSLRYYDKQNLPINIICQLKKEFEGLEVYGVTEVTSAIQVTYHITMQDEKNLVTAKVNSNGHISAVKKYKKA